MTKKLYKFKTSSPKMGSPKKKKWILVGLALSLAFGLQLYVANSVAGLGEELAQIEIKIEDEKRQNQILKEEMAQFTSISKLEEASLSLGLAKPQNVLYVKVSQETADAGR